MVENDEFFKENVKKSFKKFREHMDELRKEVNFLKKKVNEISQNLQELSLVEAKEDEISSGNQGVVSTPVNGDERSIKDQKSDKKAKLEANFEKIKEDIEKMFKGITDREFLVFLALYDLDEQLGGVSYFDIAKRLKISDSRVKNVVSDLIKKGLPIEKKTFLGNKVSLFVKEDFRSLKIAEELLKLLKLRGFSEE